MTRYSFTGPTRLAAPEAALAVSVAAGLERPSQITTGAAPGWDNTIAAAALRAWPAAAHQVICPGASYDRRGLDALVRLAVELGVDRFTVVNLPPERSTGFSYRRRNEELVAAGDVLVAAVRSLAFYRSGEWMTANIAKRAGVAIQWVDLRTVAVLNLGESATAYIDRIGGSYQ